MTDIFLHRNLTGARIHTPFSFVYADSTARLAASGFTPEDVTKKALQLSDATEWILMDDSPITWAQTGGLSYTLDTDGTLAANSDTRVPSQKAVKTYADQLIAAADAMVFKGVIDCSANPNYPAADRGHTYRISVAGKIGGGSGVNVEAGDLIICLTDSTSSGTQAGVGANWTISQANLDGAVIGPASATDNAIARYDSTTGKLIQNSLMTVDDNGKPNIPSGQTYDINGSPHTHAGAGNIEDLSTAETDTSLVYAPDGLGGVVARAETGGAGTLLRSIWNPLAPPASPTSQDDEFDNGSLDGKWTEFDPNSVLTVTENATTKGIDLVAATHSAFQLTGIYQTLPAGDFTIWTRVSAMGQNNNYLITGLALWEDPADVTKDLQVAAISPRGAGITVSVLNYSDYQNVGSTRWETTLSPDTAMAFFRIRRNSTNYYWEISPDGIGWFGTGALNTAFTPTKMGIFIDNSQGITCKSFFPFFRYIASDVGVTGVMNGNAAGIYA